MHVHQPGPAAAGWSCRHHTNQHCENRTIVLAGISKCTAPAANWRYKYMGKKVEMSLPGISYGAKASQSDCFAKCGQTAGCRQAVHHNNGHCWPMNTASKEDQDGKGGRNTGFTSVHCNAGTCMIMTIDACVHACILLPS